MIIHAKGPANFAEKYIIHSIWDGVYAPGTLLPSERELSERIGVTRTTLREVLQRLARDGWLSIQHGKPTKVNNFWETSGLNILETITELDQKGAPKLMEHLLAARKNIAMIYFKQAAQQNKEAVIHYLQNVQFPTDAHAFAKLDYSLQHQMACFSNNPIYVLILNGFQKLCFRMGSYFFDYPEAQKLTINFYQEYLAIVQEDRLDDIQHIIRQYSENAKPIWSKLRQNIASVIIDQPIASGQ